jgi:hypothetical protein
MLASMHADIPMYGSVWLDAVNAHVCLPAAASPILVCRYIMLGCSNISQEGQPFSVSHGSISTTAPDKNGFIRGDTASLPGESGGGCFSAETGKLVAMNVAADTKHGNRAVLLPVSGLVTLLSAHHLDVVQKLGSISGGGEFIRVDE